MMSIFQKIILALALTAVLTGCGGGSGGSSSSKGSVSGTILDKYDQPIESAVISLTSSLGVVSGTTPAGVYTFTGIPAEQVELQIDAAGYVSKTETVSVSASQITLANVVLEIAALPVAGVLNVTPVTLVPPVTPTGGTSAEFTFDVDVVVYDENGQNLDTLVKSDFSIGEFTKSGLTFTFSIDSAVAVPASGGVDPVSAMLLFDQSGSITDSDTTNVRLFSAKEFLSTLADQDVAGVSAFSSGPDKLIESEPVTVISNFSNNINELNSAIDSLAALEGGGSPVYDAVASTILYTNDKAITSNKVVVVFSDGKDTGSASPVENVITSANSLAVKIYTVGFLDNADQATLSKMATETGGGFFYAASAESLANYYSNLSQILTGGTSAYTTSWKVVVTGTNAAAFSGDLTAAIIVNGPQGNIEAPFTVTK